MLTIDSLNNVTDSGVGVPLSASFCLFGAEQTATDGKSVFVSTGSGVTATFTGVTAINVVNNKVIGTAVTGPLPGGITVKGSFRLR